MKMNRYLCALALSAPIFSLTISPAQAGFLDKAKDAIDRKGGEEKRDRDDAKKQSKTDVIQGAIKATQDDPLSRVEAAIYLSSAALAAQRAKVKPNTKANGLPVGLGQLKWGMSAAQVMNTKLADKAAVAVATPDKNAKSFEYRGVKIFVSSPRLYTAQVWLRKDQLNFAELRPQNQSNSPALLGVSGSDQYFAEMTALCNTTWKNWSQVARELQTDKLESTYDYQVPVARRTEYAGQQTFLRGYDNMGGAVFGSMPVYNTVTTYENRQKIKSRELPFNVIQDDWKASQNASYRIALLRGGGSNGAKNMGIARWQAQREGGSFPFLITDERSINDTKGVMADVNANYNVFPNTVH